MDLNKKFKDLENEARDILRKKQEAQKTINEYDIRLLEIKGALKSIKEVMDEDNKDSKADSVTEKVPEEQAK